MSTHDPLSSSPELSSAERASTARYGVVGFLSTLTFVLYLDRVCIGQAAVSMREDLGLSKTEMGYVLAAFTVAYGLFEVPTGRWGDRYGSRSILTRIVVWWSLFTGLTGCVGKFAWDSGLSLQSPFGGSVPLVLNSLVLLIAIRFLFGAGEAGALPNVARVVARWFPARERSLVHGFILTAMQLGGALAPVLAAQLIAHLGWRATFQIFGSIGLLWAVAFFAWFRDDPGEHAGVNEAERDLIAVGGAAAPGADQHPPIPWKLVLTSPNVWLLGMVQTCGAFAAYMYMSWFPTYLKEARGVAETETGTLASLVLAGGALGCFLGGYLSHWIGEHGPNRKWHRRLFGFFAHGIGGCALIASISCDSPVGSSVLTTIACLSAMSQQANWWAVTTETSGRHLGAMFGLMNSLGVPGAMGAQLFFGWFADRRAELGYLGRAQFDPAFYVYGAALLVGACCWLLIDVTKSIVDRPGSLSQESPQHV